MHIWKVTKHASFEANFLLWSRVSTLPLWFIFLTSKQKSLQASLLQTRVAVHNWFLSNSSTNGSLSKINTCTFVDLCATTVSLGWILVDAHTCCFVAVCSRADCGRLLICACLSRVKRGRPLWEWLHNGYVTFSSFTPIIMRLKSMKVVFCNTRLTFENTHQELPVSTAQLWSWTNGGGGWYSITVAVSGIEHVWHFWCISSARRQHRLLSQSSLAGFQSQTCREPSTNPPSAKMESFIYLVGESVLATVSMVACLMLNML